MTDNKEQPPPDDSNKTSNKPTPPAELEEKPSYKEQFLFIMKNLTIEPMLMLFCFSMGLANLPTKSFLTYRACLTNLNFSEAVCNQMIERPEHPPLNITREDEAVQNFMNHLQSNTVPISATIPVVLVLLWGSWSDRNRRRKPCVMVPLVAGLIQMMMLIVTHLNEDWPVDVLAYVSAVVQALSGGFGLMILGVLSYIADISDVKQRTMRIGAIALIFTIALNTGTTFSGDILKAIGSLNVIIICFCVKAAALLYGYIMIHDKNRLRKKGAITRKCFIVDFFNKHAITDAFTCMLKKGENNRRKKIILLLMAFFMMQGPEMTEHAFTYNFMRQAFNWNEVQIGHFVPVNGALSAIGTIIALGVLSKHFSVHDTLLVMLASFSRCLSHTTLVFASETWHLFLGTTLGMFAGIGGIALKSILSKILDDDEQGKMNSVFSIVTALCPLAFSKLLSIIYTHTVSTYPGAFFGVAAILSIPVICIFFCLYRLFKKEERMENDAVKDVEKTGVVNTGFKDESAMETSCRL